MPDEIRVSNASLKLMHTELSEQTPARREDQTASVDGGDARSIFTTANEEEGSEIVGFLEPGVAISPNRRYSARLSWKVEESCVPTRSSLDFYARRSARHSQLSRRSQLAVEVGQDEITRQLLSSKFSSSVALNLIKLPKGAHASQRHSLRRPNIGSLDLLGFLGTEFTRLDCDGSGAAGKEVKAAKEEKK